MPENKENQAPKMTAKEGMELQMKLIEKLNISPLKDMPKTIAGADVSLERFGTELFAGMIVLSYPAMMPIEYAVAKVEATFPYIPGLLSFREMPGLLECLKKLKTKPDLIMVDGQGIAHPRRMGIATHLGIETGIPTIGCAKSKLFGEFDAPKNAGDAMKILDPKTRDHLGFALKSKKGSNPLIISPGNKISAEQALEVVKNCLRLHRLPEPTRLAHKLVNEFRKGELLP
jgi:deoxyribonuclease V